MFNLCFPKIFAFCRIVVSMAPLSFDACTVPSSSLPFIGPPVPEVSVSQNSPVLWIIHSLLQACSPWMRLAIYLATGSGPASVYIPKGTRLTRLPSAIAQSPRLLVTSSSHEPQHMPTHSSLIALNDILLTTPLFVQVSAAVFHQLHNISSFPTFQQYPHYSEEDELIYVPFPFDENESGEGMVFFALSYIRVQHFLIWKTAFCLLFSKFILKTA